MSRKDPRRAIAVMLPRPVLAILRARQAQSRGRRLMDTLRVMLTAALERPDPVLAPCPPVPTTASIRLLQLPPDLRRRLAGISQDTGLSENAVICALVLGLDATSAHPSGNPPTGRGP